MHPILCETVYWFIMRTPPILFLIAVLLMLSTSFAHADIVTLKDGTTHEGTVIKENRAEVVLEIVIANIKTTKTFPRYQVRSIEYKPLESADATKEEEKDQQENADRDSTGRSGSDAQTEGRTDTEDDDSGTDRRADLRNRELFITIPVEGIIGIETNANGLKNALTQARRRKVQHIVFVIDSPGGYVYDAIESLKVLKEFDDDFVYHALVVEGAISAASIYVAASDHIWLRPESRVGGAVAYTSDNSTGAADVDAKMNSIWAAEIASRALSKGHPPEIFRAMVETGAEVWFDEEGKVYASRPGTPGAQQIDNSQTILTIRADQMIQIGMAKLFEGELDELGEQLQIANWFPVRGMGERAMQSASRERTELQERFDDAVKVFRDAYEDFNQNNPRTKNDYQYFIQPDGRRYPDGTSMQMWRERCDKAIRNCDTMLAALGRIASVNKSAKRVGAIHLEQLPDDIGHEVYTTFKEIRQWLVEHRDNMMGS